MRKSISSVMLLGALGVAGLLPVPQVAQAGSASLHVDVGLNHFYKKRYLEAFQEFKAATEVDPRNAEAHYNLARIYKLQGFFKEAAAELMLTLQIKPDHSAAQRELADIKGKLERDVSQRLKIEGKQVTVREAVEQVGQDQQQKLGQKLLAKGDLAGAATAFEAALTSNPYNPKIHAVLGYIYFQGNKFAQALERYTKAAELSPNDAEVQYALGLLHIRLDAYDRAETHLKQAIALSPDLVKAHYSLGEVYEKLEQSENALFEYRKCLALNPDLSQAKARIDSLGSRLAFQYFNRGVVYYQKGKYEKAEALLGLSVQQGQLSAAQRDQAEEMLKTSRFWIAKQQGEEKIRKVRQDVRQDAYINKDIRIEDVVNTPGSYVNQPVTWTGEVVFIDTKGGRPRYFINSNTNVKAESNLDYVFGIVFPKDLPRDSRINLYARVEVRGRVLRVEKVQNTVSLAMSRQQQPIIEATEVTFTRESESSEPLVVRFY